MHAHVRKRAASSSSTDRPTAFSGANNDAGCGAAVVGVANASDDRAGERGAYLGRHLCTRHSLAPSLTRIMTDSAADAAVVALSSLPLSLSSTA